MTILLACSGLRFFQLQLIEGELWGKRADRQHSRSRIEPAHRGTIFSTSQRTIDRGHKQFIFAQDVSLYDLFVDTTLLPQERRETFVDLCTTLIKTIDREELIKALEQKSRSRRIGTAISPAIKEKMEEKLRSWLASERIPKNALFFRLQPKRVYPQEVSLGQVLQGVRDLREESSGLAIPTGGVEMRFNELMAGNSAKIQQWCTPRRLLGGKGDAKAESRGGDLQLSVDAILQRIVEEELERGVQATFSKSGWAVMIEPSTGKLLALAHYPFFHPGEYRSFYGDPEKKAYASLKAISDAFEPGSIMKPLFLAIALHANEELLLRGENPLFDPEEPMDLRNNRFRYRERPIHDISFAKKLNMDLALQRSSNIYMARIAEKIIDRLGEHWFRSAWQELFGVGVKCNLELPGESSGFLPTVGERDRQGRYLWSKATPYSLAFGHNMQLTSLQIARSYAVIANGGMLISPTLIESEEERPTKRVLSSAVAERIKKLLFTINIDKRSDIPGYTEGGKTGSAEKAEKGGYARDERHLVSFVGFAPLETPRYVLIVSLDEPKVYEEPAKRYHHLAGYSVAPLFRAIGERALPYLGILPDDPYGYPTGDPRRDSTKREGREERDRLLRLFDQWNR